MISKEVSLLIRHLVQKTDSVDDAFSMIYTLQKNYAKPAINLYKELIRRKFKIKTMRAITPSEFKHLGVKNWMNKADVLGFLEDVSYDKRKTVKQMQNEINRLVYNLQMYKSYYYKPICDRIIILKWCMGLRKYPWLKGNELFKTAIPEIERLLKK